MEVQARFCGTLHPGSLLKTTYRHIGEPTGQASRNCLENRLYFRVWGSRPRLSANSATMVVSPLEEGRIQEL